MNIKYTSEGKKVRVVGKLNNVETIVQEIYVDATGAEIPAGENFVVKTLLDYPAEKWQQKECREIEAKLKKIQETFEIESKRLRIETGAVRRMLEAMTDLKKKFNPEQLEQLIDFVSGDIGFVVVVGHHAVEIKTFLDAAKYVEYGCCDSLRLLSLYGKNDGNLRWKMNQYCDGSGYSEGVLIPCKTHGDAIAQAQKIINALSDKNGITDALIESAKKYGLAIPVPKMIEYHVRRKKNTQNRIQQLRGQLEAATAELEKM